MPVLEVDLSLANLALDLIGQATCCSAKRGTATNSPSTATCSISAMPAGRAAERRLRADDRAAPALFDLAAHAASAADAVERPFLAEFAAKAVKEVAYHRELASEWTVRLGDGTEESARGWPRGSTGAGASPRAVRGRREPAGGIDRGIAPDPREFEEEYRSAIRNVLAEEARSPARAAPDPRRPARPSQRASGTSARGDAVPAAHLSGRDLVMDMAEHFHALRVAEDRARNGRSKLDPLRNPARTPRPSRSRPASI